MIKNPVVRDDARVKLAHEILSDVVNTMLVMSLVKLWNRVLPMLLAGNLINVMILPDIVQAMQLVRADCSGNVSPTDFRWELCGPVRMMDLQNILLADGDHSVCSTIWLVNEIACDKLGRFFEIDTYTS